MVRVRFIGDRRRLDNKLVDLMDELELLTSENDLLHLTIALNYGGRDEVARATKRLAYDVQKGRLDPKTIDEETLPKYLKNLYRLKLIMPKILAFSVIHRQILF